METIGERIKRIRKEADLSMATFGKRIGVNSSSVAKWETGENNPSERTLKLICSEFHINYLWLTKGEGEMYSNLGETILEMLVDEYHLTDLDKKIMEMYLMLTDEQRAGIHAFVQGLIDQTKKQDQ